MVKVKVARRRRPEDVAIVTRLHDETSDDCRRNVAQRFSRYLEIDLGEVFEQWDSAAITKVSKGDPENLPLIYTPNGGWRVWIRPFEE
jgi:hypothetical protein